MSESVMPPVPRITQLTKPYWDGAFQGRLMLPHCHSCGRSFFRPEVACTHCFATDWSWKQASGRGALYSFTVLHRAPVAGLKMPLVFAIVELEEGPMMYTSLVGCESERVSIGMQLEVCFEPLTQDITLPKFRPRA